MVLPIPAFQYSFDLANFNFLLHLFPLAFILVATCNTPLGATDHSCELIKTSSIRPPNPPSLSHLHHHTCRPLFESIHETNDIAFHHSVINLTVCHSKQLL